MARGSKSSAAVAPAGSTSAIALDVRCRDKTASRSMPAGGTCHCARTRTRCCAGDGAWPRRRNAG
eukprot:365800-Chlamydomonas_euryale.AAC.18